MPEANRIPPCCMPTRERAAILKDSERSAQDRLRIRTGSTEDMVQLPGGRFLMGTDDRSGFPADGEGPIRSVRLDRLWIDRYAVTCEAFRHFVEDARYQTEAERFGWSFVFAGDLPNNGLAKPPRPWYGIRWNGISY